MPSSMTGVLAAAQTGFDAQRAELVDARSRQTLAVVTKTATGTGDISRTMSLDRKFRLVFVRCHFSGTAGTDKFVVTLDSVNGTAYDTTLFTLALAGINKDVNLRIGEGDQDEPCPWTFQAGDKIRLAWTNPDSGNITWGLEVGLALAT